MLSKEIEMVDNESARLRHHDRAAHAAEPSGVLGAAGMCGPDVDPMYYCPPRGVRASTAWAAVSTTVPEETAVTPMAATRTPTTLPSIAHGSAISTTTTTTTATTTRASRASVRPSNSTPDSGHAPRAAVAASRRRCGGPRSRNSSSPNHSHSHRHRNNHSHSQRHRHTSSVVVVTSSGEVVEGGDALVDDVVSTKSFAELLRRTKERSARMPLPDLIGTMAGRGCMGSLRGLLPPIPSAPATATVIAATTAATATATTATPSQQHGEGDAADRATAAA